MTTPQFDYFTAFSRNIGWVTDAEQAILQGKRIAIAGMGGVGGVHLLTLTRLGIGAFSISDLDRFELANFNRQAGAMMSTLAQAKVEVMAQMARDLNPELELRVFAEGVSESNIEAFLRDADLYVDGLDFFTLDARRLVYRRCAELGIPIIVAAPLGMGAALINYLPGGMPLDRYFGLDRGSEDERLVRFLLGLSPAMLQRAYLVDPTAVDFLRHRGPSTPMACDLCAGFAATTALKILLGRGKVPAAPHGLQFDAYRNKLVRTWRPGGPANPLQQLGFVIARRQLSGMGKEPSAARHTAPNTVIDKILDLARWAPSGDNTQVWRFEVLTDRHVVVHGRFIGDECVYDLRGHASELALGILLETMAIAASGFGLATRVERRRESPPNRPTFDVHFAASGEVRSDPLIPYIPTRSVQRRALGTRRLSLREKRSLEQALGPGYRILWLEGFARRLQAARLMFKNAGIRLSMREAYKEHRKIIEWNARYSVDRIPDQALGVDPVLRRLMRWTLQSWKRVSFLNRYAAGTWLPRIEMDLIPGILCGAHFVIHATNPPAGTDDYVSAGRAIQRFWLTAARLGLQLQPETTPLIFAAYLREGIPFTENHKIQRRAGSVARELDGLIGREFAGRAVFMGRIGHGARPTARSLRLPLDELKLAGTPAPVDPDDGASG